MDKTLLNKLKNRALSFASDTLLKIELTSEEGRLKIKFQNLGKKLYKSIQDDLLKTIKDDPSVVELIGSIEETQKKIEELKVKISNSPKDSSEET